MFEKTSKTELSGEKGESKYSNSKDGRPGQHSPHRILDFFFLFFLLSCDSSQVLFTIPEREGLRNPNSITSSSSPLFFLYSNSLPFYVLLTCT